MVGRKSAQAAPGRKMVGRKSARPSARPRARRPRRRASPGPSLPTLLPLVLLPAAATLAVTLLRLGGELLGWSPRFFSTLPGGGLAIVGITWLVPVAGFYLGDRLTRVRAVPASAWRAFGLPLAALVLVPLLARVMSPPDPASRPTDQILAWALASVAGLVLGVAAWPKLGSLLLSYALLARLPVVLVMGLAMRWGWGTHYDAPIPGFPPMVPLTRWWWTGVVPQLTVWLAFTVVVGALFGALAWHLASRRAA
jgi:hypothetical protein